MNDKDETIRQMMEAYEEMLSQKEPRQKTADQWETRRLNDLIERLQFELKTYFDFQLWLKFTHPNIIDEYKCVKDVERSV